MLCKTYEFLNRSRRFVLSVAVFFLAMPALARDPDSGFALLADEYLQGYFNWRPQTAVALGLHEYDGKLENLSEASIEAERDRLRDYLRRVRGLNLRKASENTRLEARLLESNIRTELFAIEERHSYSENPMTYAAFDLNVYIKRNFAPLEKRLRSIVEVEEQAPKIFAAARANLNRSLPAPFIETAAQVANGAADFLSADLPRAVAGARDPDLLARFNLANAKMVSALRDYADYVKLKSPNPEFALGRDKYAQMLAAEFVDVSPEKLLEIGLRELKKEQQVFADAAGLIDPSARPQDVFLRIQSEHPRAETLISESAKNLEAIRSFVVARKLVTIPSEVRAHVEETPQYARATSFASMDTPGPFEKKATDAYYYITPTEASWSPEEKEQWLTAFNYFTTDVVSIHEAYPGHYVQFLSLNASPVSRLSKVIYSYAFVEGWAHYSEQMVLDEGFPFMASANLSAADRIRAAKYRLAQSDEALLRLCRLCVSIKMHCQGMTVEEGTQFFEDHCYYQPKPARQEAMRGTFDPGYLYYAIGKLELLKLRNDYQKQEGADFSLQKFHDEVLRHGAPPIRLLRELMLNDKAAWPEIL